MENEFKPNYETEKKKSDTHIAVIFVSVVIICLFVIILYMGCHFKYDYEIISYFATSSTTAELTYEITNKEDIDNTYEIRIEVTKDGKEVTYTIAMCCVKAHSTEQNTVYLTTLRDVSFYGSTAKIRVTKLSF